MSKPAEKGEGSKASMDIDLTDEQVKMLEESQKELDFSDLGSYLADLKRRDVVFAKRREVVKKLTKFWSTAFFNNKFLEHEAEKEGDKDALSYLEEIWVQRDATEPRAHKIEMHFAENPYFSNKVLVKDYSYSAPQNQDSAVDEYGLTAAQRDFDEERDIKPLAATINWKSDDKNLVKLHPRKAQIDELEYGSFFNWFTDEEDVFDTGSTIIDMFDEAIKYYLNQADEDELSDIEEEDEEDN